MDSGRFAMRSAPKSLSWWLRYPCRRVPAVPRISVHLSCQRILKAWSESVSHLFSTPCAFFSDALISKVLTLQWMYFLCASECTYLELNVSAGQCQSAFLYILCFSDALISKVLTLQWIYFLRASECIWKWMYRQDSVSQLFCTPCVLADSLISKVLHYTAHNTHAALR